MRGRRAALLAIACVGLAYSTLIQPIGWNQASHYALIRSIDAHTPRIDRYAGSTGDRARYHDDSTGTLTAGTANTWQGNTGDTQNRPGLLASHGHDHDHDDDDGDGDRHRGQRDHDCDRDD